MLLVWESGSPLLGVCQCAFNCYCTSHCISSPEIIPYGVLLHYFSHLLLQYPSTCCECLVKISIALKVSDFFAENILLSSTQFLSSIFLLTRSYKVHVNAKIISEVKCQNTFFLFVQHKWAQESSP